LEEALNMSCALCRGDYDLADLESVHRSDSSEREVIVVRALARSIVNGLLDPRYIDSRQDLISKILLALEKAKNLELKG